MTKTKQTSNLVHRYKADERSPVSIAVFMHHTKDGKPFYKTELSCSYSKLNEKGEKIWFNGTSYSLRELKEAKEAAENAIQWIESNPASPSQAE